MRTRLALASGFSLTLAVHLGSPRDARAQDLPVAVRADKVELDVKTQALDASGNVRVDVPPFHLESDRVKLSRSPIGVVMDGEGTLYFCPCLGAPLAVAFDGATVAPPDDVVVKNPRLLVYGVPVFWLPAFWLRSPARVGLLAPDVAYRGADGLFVGEGIHVPWRKGDAHHGVDLRAGAYLEGGAAVDARVYTEDSTTHLRWDRLHGDDGVTAQARGALGEASRTVAWDVDALRGKRGVLATTDLDAAARPYDRASADAAWRDAGFTFSAGVRDSNRRGGDVLDLGAFGPVVAARRGAALGDAGAYDLRVEGGSLRAPDGGAFAPLSYGRAAGGGVVATRLGAFDGSLAIRGAVDAGSDGARTDTDGAASLRLRGSLPLVRMFDSGDADDPWVHRIDPRLEVGALAQRTAGLFATTFAPALRDDAGAAWLATGGVASAFGRFGSRIAAELDVAAGAIGAIDWAKPLVRARADLGHPWLGLGGESAHVLPTAAGGAAGDAFVVRARVGPVLGPSLSGNVAARIGLDPVAARALVDAPLEPTSGFLSQEGWSAGARAAVPFGKYVAARGGADVDLTGERLVAAAGSLELRDPCGCVVVRANASHRIGREGVDVWLTVDLPRGR